MDRVVHYEQRRNRLWWWVFWIALGALVVVFGTTIYAIIHELREKETLSIFGIVTEDGAAWTSAWRDIVAVIWGDLTHWRVYTAVGAVVLTMGVVIGTAHRRRTMGRVQHDISQLKSERQEKPK